MAAPAWATDLTSFWTADTAASTVTNFTLTGGPTGATNNPETDYYVQGGATPASISKNAFAASTKGFIIDNLGTTFTVPTDGIVLAWGIFTAVGSLAAKASGGLRIAIGDSATSYNQYYVGGSDTLIFESWVPYVVNPNAATADAGTVTTNWRWVGIIAALPTGGPTKGAPLAIDAIRYGRHTLTYTLGDGSPNYNTFALAEATANSLANRWGNIEYNKGAYYVQGFHSFGSSGTLVDFRDSNKVVFIRASGANNGTNDAVTTGYNRFEILNASSNVDWDNVTFQALGTRARGVFVHTAGTFDATNCQFIDVDTFSLLSTSVMTDCTFRRTNAITAPGSDLRRSRVLTPTIAADTSAIVWNVNTNPNGKLDGMTFSKGTNAHHAINLGASSPTTVTLTGITFTGFNSSDAQNDSVLYLSDQGSDKAWTINAIGCTGTVSYKKARSGDTVTVNQGVSVSIHAQDIDTAADIANARAWVKVASSAGGYPYQAAVSTLTQTAGTATCTTSATHNLKTNDYVYIEGASPQAYNGTHQITVTGGSTFTFTIDSGTSSPATGTIKVTLVLIHGLTDSSGNISSSAKSYSAAQPITGRIRRASAGYGKLYKTSPITGTIDTANGLSLVVQMLPDL